jgi:hypothetical protein
MNNIHQQLNNWGQAQRTLPSNNSALKISSINQLRTGDELKNHFSFPWRAFAISSFAVLAVIAIIPQISKYNTASKTSVSEISQNTNSTGLALNTANKAPSLNKPDEFSVQSQNLAKDLPVMQNTESHQKRAVPYYDSVTEPAMLPAQTNQTPITDTREFLKTYYSSQIQSRDVEEFSQTAKTTVKGFGGRIDSLSSSKESSYISFSLPADKLDAFKLQLKTLAGGKFYVENLSAQNYLPQKQQIEAAARDNSTKLANVENQKQSVINNHNKIIAGLNAQAKANSNAINDVKLFLQTNPTSLELQQRLLDLQKQQNAINNKISKENTNYKYQIDSLNSQIEYYNKQAQNLNKEDLGLVDNVNTAQGTISVTRINFLQYLNTYLPLYWVLVIFVIISGLYFAFKKQTVQAV